MIIKTMELKEKSKIEYDTLEIIKEISTSTEEYQRILE